MNWKLAQQAFQEQYHVVEAHPQLVIPGMRYGARDGEFDPRAFVDAELQYLRTMSEGMAGMVHANDVRIAEGLRDIDLPADPEAAMSTWYRALNDAVVDWHRAAGSDIPDLNELEAAGPRTSRWATASRTSSCCPMYSSASSYRFRPLGPEETLMEIWSLTRFPEGAERRAAHAAGGVGVRRPPLAADPRPGLLEPARASSGACTRRASSTCACPRQAEGHLSNLERVIDGFLAGLPHERAAPGPAGRST